MQLAQNHYTLLGVAPSATEKEINEAYRKLAFQYHPDRNQMSPESNKIMRELNEAYSTLSLGYHAIVAKFKAGSKVKINSHSSSPYRDHIGTVDRESVKDTFRFWYMVKFEAKYFSTINKFAEEELSKVDK